jgi:hypothetical protein
VSNETEKILLGYIRSQKIDMIIDQYKDKPNVNIHFTKKKVTEMNELFLKSSRGIEVEYDSSPLVIFANTPLTRIFYLFSVMGLSHTYVIDKGALSKFIFVQTVSRRHHKERFDQIQTLIFL